MKVLVFGGTQFMGRLAVEALLRAGHEVVLLNRGRTANPFQGWPNLKAVPCDRMGDREAFRRAIRAQGPSDAVLDFIGFQEVFLQDAVEALTVSTDTVSGRTSYATKHYVFISTDSVYWALKVPIGEEKRLSEALAEDFSPAEFEEHLEHCNKTSLGEYQLRYGGNKLACERVLQDAWGNGGFPYTILRLPDVYGPYDNLGGFWDVVSAVEMKRPIPANLSSGRVRVLEGQEIGDARTRRFTWAFAEDVRDAVVACVEKGSQVCGLTMNVGHEEAVSLRETAAMIGEALGVEPSELQFDDHREAALPSTDYGALDVGVARRMLHPWRPTPMRQAVRRAVQWFRSSREHRRYHRLVHREAKLYDESRARHWVCRMHEVPSCWVGAAGEKACLLNAGGPVMLSDALPACTGQAVLGFMQQLMDQAGEMLVQCELLRGPDGEAERQTWPLRHVAGNLLPQSEHSAAYRLETPDVLAKTTLLPGLRSPLDGLQEDKDGPLPARRILRLGGSGARWPLRRRRGTSGGSWDCVLLGRRKWRLFPPEASPASLCCRNGSDESPADCFACGPDVAAVQSEHVAFAPMACWECEQTMGEAVVVPDGWWYQSYDDDRTLSICARYGVSAMYERVD